MSSQSTLSAGTAAAGADPAFELKAATFTLPLIRLLGVDMDAVEAQLIPRVEQAPSFFRNTPVVIDLGAVADANADVSFPHLVGLLRGLGMIPVGVRGGTLAQNEAAKAMELAILGDAVRSKRREPALDIHMDSPPPAPHGHVDPAPVAAQTDAPLIGVNTGSTLIDRPVRSGQRVYAAGGDLTVTAPVSSGAELMADGNIHIYAPMRGRAIAGLKGDATARIFCQDLRAELISVAGHYRVSENIPDDLKGKRVQVFLDHDVLRIEPI